MAEAIRAARPRVLFVGMTSPRKEQFLAAHLEGMGPVFAMGVGGSFDVWAGLAKRAPRWMQRVGLSGSTGWRRSPAGCGDVTWWATRGSWD